MKLGIDFGTTNSAVAVVDPEGRPHILELVPGERTQRTVIHADLQGTIRFGNAAFRSYVESDLRGRFLRSIKAFLPHDVPSTRIGRTTVSFTDLVARFLTFLAESAERVSGRRITDVVVGRPVVFHADPAKHERAVDQLRTAITASGLPEPRLQLEPVAAALRYESSLDSDRTVLVGDFGGGTADFAVLEVGPGHRGDGVQRVLGTAGVAQAGNALDARFLDAFVLDFLGRGITFVPRGSKTPRPWTPMLLRQIGDLYDVHRLRDPQMERYLRFVETRTGDATAVERLRRLVFDDLGYPMAGAIEAAKGRLSHAPTADFVFDAYHSDRLNIETTVDRARFAEASEAILADYEQAIDEMLHVAGLGPEGIDDVFLTGGTSQLTFIQDRFAARFGRERVRGGEAFTTVCEGLAIS